MDGGSLHIVLGSDHANPFLEHSDEISQLLAVQGFLSINTNAQSDLLSRAVSEVDTLDSASRLYAPAEVLVDGLLGDEGSTRIVELSSFDEETNTLEILNQTIQAASDSARQYLSALGFETLEQSNLLVHRGGLDMVVPRDMDAEESMKFMSIFGRHILMILLFLGPGEGTLELQPFDADADTQEIRTKPGMIVILRPDVLLHRHIPDGDDTVLSCWTLVPASLNSRSGQPALMQTPVVQELDKAMQQKMLEMKAKQDSEQEQTESLPLSLQMEMNRRFFSGYRAAVRGIGVRLPGAMEAEKFWQILCFGTDYVTDIPFARWDHSKFYNADPESYEKTHGHSVVTNIRHASFADGTELFDHKFFGLSPAEAKCTSPDQRLTLECAYEAMHEHGYNKMQLTKNAEYLGVFMSTGYIDFGCADRCEESYGMALGGSTVSAARTSFCLGMRGPCITFDNEGASSLITTVLAVQSVVPSNERWSKAGNDCPASLTGASKILTTPFQWPRYGYWMDPKGRTMVFDESARGHVQGEGVVMMCVGSLSQMVDGKPVIQKEADRGAICGWRINSNGMNASMTAPNGSQQQECIQMALKQAGINPWDIDAVEVHGSAMQLDDAIEATSLALCLRGTDETSNEVLQLGTTKTNVGNQIEVAGVLAMLKVAYGTSYLSNVPNLHLRTLNPNIDLDDSMPLLMHTETLPYRSTSAYHGITALSQNGTNAHVTMWGAMNEKMVDVVPKAVVAQDICYWPAGGGKLETGAKAVIGYFIAGSCNGWEATEMIEAQRGLFTFELTIGENRYEEFQIWLDGDKTRALCPGAAQALHGSAVHGPVPSDVGASWMIGGSPLLRDNPGDRYKVSLKIAGKYRAVTWEKVHVASRKDELQLHGRYFIAGSVNDWQLQEMQRSEESPDLYTVEVGPLAPKSTSFVIVRNEDWSQTFHASPHVADGVTGPVDYNQWIGHFQLDGGMGDIFRVKFRRVIDFGVDAMTIEWERVSQTSWPKPLR